MASAKRSITFSFRVSLGVEASIRGMVAQPVEASWFARELLTGGHPEVSGPSLKQVSGIGLVGGGDAGAERNGG
jgi:hypothetical protein